MQTNNFNISTNDISTTIYKARHSILSEDWCLEKTKDPYSRIYFVKEGNGTLQFGDRELPFLGGMIYLIPAELEFSLRSSHFEKIYIHISVLSLEKYDIFARLDEIYALPCSAEEYETVLGYLHSQNYYDKVKLKMHLLSVFARIQQEYSLPGMPIRQYSELVCNILDYIQSNLSLKLRVSNISEHFFVSESKIRDTFRKETGIPLGKYIDDMVFTRARQLLADGSIPISRISATLGFCDQFYFSRQFSKKFGMTPSQFRKLI